MSSGNMCFVTRVEKFSASHRLHASSLSAEDNIELYGPCNNPNGHGHNYTLETTVRGRVDPATGMVMNISVLKKTIAQKVLIVLDHKNLDKDVPAFRDTGLVSTTENVAIVIFDLLKNEMPVDVTLYKVKLHETDKNSAEYYGDTNKA